MTPEAWTFFGLCVGGIVTVSTTTVVQQFTTKRALIAKQNEIAESAAGARTAAETAAGSAGSAAESAAVAVAQTRPISNGTVPSILRKLDEHGDLLKRIIDDQREQRTLIVGHLADHARVAMTPVLPSPPMTKPQSEGTAP